jgi:hypothetical protein
MDEDLKDLAEHLAYHASTGYAECRYLDAPPQPDVEPSFVVDDGLGFEVEHRGRRFTVIVVETPA